MPGDQVSTYLVHLPTDTTAGLNSVEGRRGAPQAIYRAPNCLWTSTGRSKHGQAGTYLL